MKNTTKIFKFLIVFLFVSSNSFASVKPISGIGILVKKHPGSTYSKVSTGNNGGFSIPLEEGEYEVSFPQDQLQTVIDKLIKRNYPKSTYQYDGSGVELTLDNPEIRVKLKPARENIFTINEQNSSFIISVPSGGSTFSGILSWNDEVMNSSISCQDGFVMQDGVCVPMTNDASDNRGIEKSQIKRNSTENTSDATQRKGWDGSIKGNKIETENTSDATQRKGWDGTVKGGSKTETQKSINNINGGMPNRISMNVTVAKQTQGATFGEKVNSGKINVTLIEDGCVVLFPSNEGYKVNTSDKSINELSKKECAAFGEKVNAGLHAAGSALSQGASLLGGALPGGAIISAAVSSVGNLAGGGAAAASYAATGRMNSPNANKQVLKIQDSENDAAFELANGEYELVFVIVENATSGLKDTLKTQVRLGFSIENGVLKPKQYTGHVTLMK